MLSIIIFKVLDRYAAAATMSSDSLHHSNNYNDDSHNSNNNYKSSTCETTGSQQYNPSMPSLSPDCFSTPSTSSSSLSSLHNYHQTFSSLTPAPSISHQRFGNPSATNPSSHLTTDTDTCHTTAQLVLGELHHAQRLVDELCARFATTSSAPPPLTSTSPPPSYQTSDANIIGTSVIMGEDDNIPRNAADQAGHHAATTAGMASSISNKPISSTMLSHLEQDLQKRMSGVREGVLELIRTS